MKRILIIAAGALVTACAALPAATPAVDESVIAEFWACDLASSETMLGMSDAAGCSLAYEQVLKSFPGEGAARYKAFISWWSESKAAGHAAARRSHTTQRLNI